MRTYERPTLLCLGGFEAMTTGTGQGGWDWFFEHSR